MMLLVRDLLKRYQDVQIVLVRDHDSGAWLAWPVGWPWPEGIDAERLPVGRAGSPVIALAGLMLQPARVVT